MSQQNLIPNGNRVNLDLILKEEFHQSSESRKHDLSEDLQHKEILCLNNDETLKGQIGKGTFKCEYCDFKCSRPDDLKSHIPSHLQVVVEDIKSFREDDYSEEEKIHVCEECGIRIVFTKTKTNQTQIQIYNNNSNDSCEKCNNKLIKVGDISKSFRNPKSDKIHTCPYCEVKFTSSGELDCHMEQHNIDQELLYPDSEEENLAQDINDDSGYLENDIIKQEKYIKQESQITTFIEDHHLHDTKRKNIIDDKHEKNITKKYKSSKSNAKFRPNACSLCPFRAVEIKTLERHIATHFVDKKFACPDCSYKGMSATSLQQHLKTHSGEKPLGCTQCHYRTSTSANLRRHERQHTGEKPFACTDCDYRAAQKIALQNHMKSKHNL